ncbi:carbohydrate-binding protein [Chitinilyticum litopenaei]|uniref:carbohydrate-binding protein n=1 Tax=Chitinilyticum litopenaei TaxID=1121276 RepID=UPI00048B641D|nr:carbohydrate-binding protein [Chitinilyticum litopenaei]
MMASIRLQVMGLLLGVTGVVMAAGSWREGVVYRQGDRVFFDGREYVAIQGHEAVKGAGWTPAQAPSLWQLAPQHAAAGGSAWREGRHYRRGDRVSYRGKVYVARQEHDAQPGAGWNPEQAASLWEYVPADRPGISPRPALGK